MNMDRLNRAIYIVGGILIVLAAVKVIWSGGQYVMNYLQDRNAE